MFWLLSVHYTVTRVDASKEQNFLFFQRNSNLANLFVGKLISNKVYELTHRVRKVMASRNYLKHKKNLGLTHFIRESHSISIYHKSEQVYRRAHLNHIIFRDTKSLDLYDW